MLLREVLDNPGLLRQLSRFTSYKILYNVDYYDGPLAGVVSINNNRYWFSLIQYIEYRSFYVHNPATIYAAVKLCDVEIAWEDQLQKDFEEAKNNNKLHAFYKSHGRRYYSSLYTTNDVVGWFVDPPEEVVGLVDKTHACAMATNPDNCPRCGGWRNCDKISNKEYLNKLEHSELVEIIENLLEDK
jgi:hypothetical protein